MHSPSHLLFSDFARWVSANAADLLDLLLLLLQRTIQPPIHHMEKVQYRTVFKYPLHARFFQLHPLSCKTACRSIKVELFGGKAELRKSYNCFPVTNVGELYTANWAKSAKKHIWLKVISIVMRRTCVSLQ